MKNIFSFPLDHDDPVKVFSALRGEPYSLLFDSADHAHPLSQHSFIAYHPFETIEAAGGGSIIVTNRDQQLSFDGDPFHILSQRLAGWGLDMPQYPHLPPFQGGAAGFFGYDLARSLENLPDAANDNAGLPDMAVGLYDRVVAFDHAHRRASLIVLAEDEKDAQAKFEHFKALVANNITLPTPGVGADIRWTSNFMQKSYESAVQKIIDYIYAGDIFQANLSQRFTADLPPGFDPFAHYLVLRAVNAAPFASYMNFGSFQISSASPERFLQVRDRQAETRPIKGTRPRAADSVQDKALRQELVNSEKDHAENAMIVDLMRNDLSKVCEDFSIRAPQLCEPESFASVHHLVSVVTGTLRADRSPVDLLRACFPGGSITGAPKVRAMEIIEEFEPVRRGPYCGALGYIGFNGAMDTNIAIRTIVYERDKAWFNAGGGIVADSNPAAEYQETLDKAAAIFRSFEISEPATKTGT